MPGVPRYRLLILLGCVAVACFQTYTGIYFLNRAGDVSSDRAQLLAQSLSRDLAELGFMELPHVPSSTLIAFGKGPLPESAPGRVFAGADANVTVGIDVRSPSITVRDLSNNVETAFVREVKRRIELRLQEQGLSGARFERQNDFLYY